MTCWKNMKCFTDQEFLQGRDFSPGCCVFPQTSPLCRQRPSPRSAPPPPPLSPPPSPPSSCLPSSASCAPPRLTCSRDFTLDVCASGCTYIRPMHTACHLSAFPPTMRFPFPLPCWPSSKLKTSNTFLSIQLGLKNLYILLIFSAAVSTCTQDPPSSYIRLI